MTRLAITAFCALAMAAMAGSAQAQINPFRGTGPRMETGDMALMDKAALPLIEDSTVAPGTSNDWRNEASGWSGTVTFKRSAKRGKLSCRVLDYRIATPQRPADRNYTITWCRDTDGTWKIA